MHDQRAEAALARIERALHRIERAAAAGAETATDGRELERLRSAHALLRRRVESAIGEIDQLLEPAEGRG